MADTLLGLAIANQVEVIDSPGTGEMGDDPPPYLRRKRRAVDRDKRRPCSLALSHQRNDGDNDFYNLRQSDSIFIDNSILYSEFKSPKERSWKLQYDIDLTAYDAPVLSFMIRYALGADADYLNANSVCMRRDVVGNQLTNQKCWGRNIEAKYIAQSGSLKDMSFRWHQMTTRVTEYESDLDDVRVIVKYPL